MIKVAFILKLNAGVVFESYTPSRVIPEPSSIVSSIISAMRQTSLLIGPRVLLDVLLGKYYQPSQEKRIFQSEENPLLF